MLVFFGSTYRYQVPEPFQFFGYGYGSGYWIHFFKGYSCFGSGYVKFLKVLEPVNTSSEKLPVISGY